jgi:hypothetical protein
MQRQWQPIQQRDDKIKELDNMPQHKQDNKQQPCTTCLQAQLSCMSLHL